MGERVQSVDQPVAHGVACLLHQVQLGGSVRCRLVHHGRHHTVDHPGQRAGPAGALQVTCLGRFGHDHWQHFAHRAYLIIDICLNMFSVACQHALLPSKFGYRKTALQTSHAPRYIYSFYFIFSISAYLKVCNS